MQRQRRGRRIEVSNRVRPEVASKFASKSRSPASSYSQGRAASTRLRFHLINWSEQIELNFKY